MALTFAAGALLVGLILLMVGRRLWRAISALAFAGAGFALAPWAATLAKISPLWMMLILAVVLGALGVLLARLFWSALFASLLATAAIVGVICLISAGQLPGGASPMPSAFDAAKLTTLDWAIKAQATLLQWVQWLMSEKAVLAVGSAAGAAVLGLLAGLFLPVFTRIILCSTVGAALAVGGVATGILSVRNDFDFAGGYRPWILLGVGGLLWLIGLSYQARSERRAKEAREKQKKEAEKKKEAAAPPQEPAKAAAKK